MFKKIAIPAVLLALVVLAPSAVQAQNLAAPVLSVGSSHIVSWQPVNNAIGYEMMYRTDDMGWTVMQRANKVTTSHPFAGMPSGNYQVRVRSAFADGFSAWSNTLSLTVPESTKTIPARGKHQTPRIGISSKTVSWDRIASASGYQLRYRVANGKWYSWDLPGEWVNSFTFTSIRKDIDYHVQLRVSPSSNTDASDWSNTVIMRENSLKTLPGPTNVRIRWTAFPRVQLTINWDRVPNAADYSLILKPGTHKLENYGGYHPWSVIDRPDYTTTYTLQIQTIGDGITYAKNGGYSTPLTFVPNDLYAPPVPPGYATAVPTAES